MEESVGRHRYSGETLLKCVNEIRQETNVNCLRFNKSLKRALPVLNFNKNNNCFLKIVFFSLNFFLFSVVAGIIGRHRLQVNRKKFTMVSCQIVHISSTHFSYVYLRDIDGH